MMKLTCSTSHSEVVLIEIAFLFHNLTRLLVKSNDNGNILPYIFGHFAQHIRTSKVWLVICKEAIEVNPIWPRSPFVQAMLCLEINTT